MTIPQALPSKDFDVLYESHKLSFAPVVHAIARVTATDEADLRDDIDDLRAFHCVKNAE